MPNFGKNFDITNCMEELNNFLKLPVIRIFVYGTLRQQQRLGFYLSGAEYEGRYYTRGQLMKADNGSVYIDFSDTKAITIGEVYYVDFFSLQRINHLEVFSGEFPRGYELNVLPVWKLEGDENKTLEEKNKIYSFFYKIKNYPMKILSGDFSDDFQPIEKLEELLRQTKGSLGADEIIKEMKQKLSIFESPHS